MGASEVLPVVLYLLGSILLVVLIILGIKLIITMNKIENVVDDINGKVKSLNGLFLNGLFSIIDVTTDKISLLSDKMIDGVINLFRKIFRSKERNDENE